MKLCSAHHVKQSRGKPLFKKSYHEMTLKEHLLKFVKKDEVNGCWLWTGTKSKKGYGSLSYNNKTYIAHRFSYAAYKGLFPANMLVYHTCGVPACINPDHLFLDANSV